MSIKTTSEQENAKDVDSLKTNERKSKFAWCNSFTFWLVLMLLACTIGVSQINYYKIFPKERISAAMHTRASAIFKNDEWKALGASNKKIDVVVVGSSLPMCCCYYADAEKDAETFLKIKDRGLKLLQAYTAAVYLEKKIQEKTGNQKSKVFNATIAASMISDNQLVVSKLLENPPKKIILAVGMRDFADNVNVSFGGTPVFQALLDLPYIVSKDNLAFLFQNAKRSTLEELFAGKILPLYMIHSELGTWLSEDTDKLFKDTKKSKTEIEYAKDAAKVSNIQATGDKLPANTTAQSKPLVLDKLDYTKRYMPFNHKQMQLEQKSLERICKLCKEKNVELILVNMPVSSGHKKLSSFEMRQKYLDGLKAISTKYGVKYLDFENSNLVPDKDFLDTVHMGQPGATKFIDYLVGESGVFAN